MAEQPKNWPSHLTYLSKPTFSKRLRPEQRAALTQRQTNDVVVPASLTTVPSTAVKITSILDAKHPAHGQYGLFAGRALKPGNFILLYIGNVHGGRSEDPDAAPDSDYDLWLDRDAGVAVDAASTGNEARFINDYRGVAERPNAEFREVWSEKFGQRCMAVFVLPERTGKARAAAGKGGIAKGQEILVSYGKGFWSHRSDNAEG